VLARHAGVRHIVALRGDSPDGIGQAYNPVQSGYAYGSDLVAGLKAVADFDISVAAYPEQHPESGSWDAFLRFIDRVQDAGITLPIIPGIMLQPNFHGLKRMADMCGVNISNGR